MKELLEPFEDLYQLYPFRTQRDDEQQDYRPEPATYTVQERKAEGRNIAVAFSFHVFGQSFEGQIKEPFVQQARSQKRAAAGGSWSHGYMMILMGIPWGT